MRGGGPDPTGPRPVTGGPVAGDSAGPIASESIAVPWRRVRLTVSSILSVPRRRRNSLISFVTVVAILAAWILVTSLGLASPRVLPSPLLLVSEFRVLLIEGYADKPLWVHVGASALRTATGFVLGVAVGIPVGLLMGWSEIASSVLSPVFAALRPIPPIAFIPLFILFFGLGEPPKIFLIFLVTLYYIVLNTSAGVRLVPRLLIQAGSNIGLSRVQLFRDVIIPGAMPQLFTGVKTAIALSWGLVVAAELIAAQEGLGYLISDAGTFFRIPDVYLGIIIIAVIGIFLETVVVAVEERVLHWRGK